MEFFLDFDVCKSVGSDERNGNYVFQVEASNENIDFQDQIVLQSALIKSKDNFLKNGVISYDHLHRRKDEDGNVVSDPSMIIGEPIDVWTEGDKTFVKGMLYKANEKAQEVVKLLKSGSTRIRASVGGMFPKTTRGEDGVERIVSVLWNDLALTPCPVNNTVGAASFAKSFTPSAFARALSAGCSADSGSMDGGESLVAEDLARRRVPVDAGGEGEPDEDEVVKSLLGLIEGGRLNDVPDVYEYLVSRGIAKEDSWASAQQIERVMGGILMARNSITSKIKEMLKSTEHDGDQPEKAGEEKEGDTDVDLDIPDGDDGDEGEEEPDEDEMQKGKDCKKSLTKGVDATELLHSLVGRLEEDRVVMEGLRKSMADLGDAVVEIAKAVAKNSTMVKSLAEEPVGTRARMSKSMSASAVSREAMTQSDFKWAQGVLVKAVKDGEIDIAKSAMIERDLQLAMATPGHQMNPEYYNFLSKKFAGGN